MVTENLRSTTPAQRPCTSLLCRRNGKQSLEFKFSLIYWANMSPFSREDLSDGLLFYSLCSFFHPQAGWYRFVVTPFCCFYPASRPLLPPAFSPSFVSSFPLFPIGLDGNFRPWTAFFTARFVHPAFGWTLSIFHHTKPKPELERVGQKNPVAVRKQKKTETQTVHLPCLPRSASFGNSWGHSVQWLNSAYSVERCCCYDMQRESCWVWVDNCNKYEIDTWADGKRKLQQCVWHSGMKLWIET